MYCQTLYNASVTQSLCHTVFIFTFLSYFSCSIVCIVIHVLERRVTFLPFSIENLILPIDEPNIGPSWIQIQYICASKSNYSYWDRLPLGILLFWRCECFVCDVCETACFCYCLGFVFKSQWLHYFMLHSSLFIHRTPSKLSVFLDHFVVSETVFYTYYCSL